VVGATAFDYLRDHGPTQSRPEFLEKIGLPENARYIVYLGSSSFIAPFDVESTYVRAFIAAMRQSPDEQVANLWVIVRPHPQSIGAWSAFSLERHASQAIVHPKDPSISMIDDSSGFVNAIHFAEAVVGINTSAMIEAAIIDKPVLSVVSVPSQRETIHFRYLRDGGFLLSAPLNEQVVELLSEVLKGLHDTSAMNARFVQSFVSPHGSDRPAAAWQVEEIERVATLRPARTGPGLFSTLLLSPLLYPLRWFGAREYQRIATARSEEKNRPSWEKIGDRFAKHGGRILFGLTAHNGERHIALAVDSILAQTKQDFLLLCVDDASSDRTQEILQGYAKRDPRVVYYRPPHRLGMVAAWRAAFEIGMKLQPQTEYFAWVSDHDVWHPEWLKTMAGALDADPGLVLAYHASVSIDENGKRMGKPARPLRFDTVSKWDGDSRFDYVCGQIVGAGDMVYGLMRADAVAACGVFRRVLLPDRLLMLELALHGRFWQSEQILWSRRRITASSIARQRRTLFGAGYPPIQAYLPWWLVFGSVFLFHHLLGRSRPAGSGRFAAFGRAWTVLRTQATLEWRKKMNRWRFQRAQLARVRHAVTEATRGWLEARRIRRAFRQQQTPAGKHSPQILLVGRQSMHLPYYRTVVDALLRRGARIDLLLDREWVASEPHEALRRVNDLARLEPQFRVSWGRRRSGALREVVFPLRELRSYSAYLSRTGQSEHYATRWFKLLTPAVQTSVREGWLRGLVRRKTFLGALNLIEHLVPPSPAVLNDLVTRRPDAILASPVIQRFSEEVEYIKAARYLGIPTAISTLSWDTLSTKGLVQIMPDELYVWNDMHRNQARLIHNVPAERIHVTGAPFFDRWFDSVATPMDRNALCRLTKLDPTREFVLYLGSSKNIARDESWFVSMLARFLAEHENPSYRSLQVLVRPHPANAQVYEKIADANVVVWRTDGTLPDTDEAHAVFRAAFEHARVIMGINTSAMIDAVLSNRPCATIRVERYAATQSAAEHFRMMVDFGAITVLDGIPDLVPLVDRLRRGEDPTIEQRRAFVAAFARPGGIARSAGDRVAERVVQLALNHRPSVAPPDKCITVQQAEIAMASTRVGAQLIGRRRQSEVSRPYQSYLRARQAVLEMIDDETVEMPEVSAYWREEMAGFDYMFDASPLIIDRLREHCHHITGIKSYDYRDHHTHKAPPMLNKLAALREIDPIGVFVAESPALGGFGFRTSEGDLINIDTLKFYEVLIGMGQAQLLQMLRQSNGTRQRIIEIGTGWGGFAYKLKSLYPSITYILLDLPQTMLFSATYLQAQFPDAQFAFITDAQSATAVLGEIDSYDFVFISHHLFNKLSAIRLDLAINMVSFQEMGTSIVQKYVHGLADMGCARLYSLNRNRSPHNSELTSVADIIGERYSLQEIELLPQQYTQFGPPPPVAKPKGIHDYRHHLATLAV
jgi:glycosyltransferase involved in cell wall biosynthesis